MQFQSKIQENKNIYLLKENSYIAEPSKPLNADTEDTCRHMKCPLSLVYFYLIHKVLVVDIDWVIREV